MKISELPKELTVLVHEITDLWGQIVHEEGGEKLFKNVEALRKSLKSFRNKNMLSKEIMLLKKVQKTLSKMSPSELEDLTHSFSVLLELINLCENAVRSQKIKDKKRVSLPESSSKFETYLVLTAHPTESRAPEIVHNLQNIQIALSKGLGDKFLGLKEEIKPLLRNLWYLRMAREEKPQVKDEAEYIFSVIFRPEVLNVLLQKKNVFLRTWVGGDKDGHPGVNSEVMLQSLSLSREKILLQIDQYCADTRESLVSFYSLSRKDSKSEIQKSLDALASCQNYLSDLTDVVAGDAKHVADFIQCLERFEKTLSASLKKRLTSFQKMKSLCTLFPSLVIPLELRESSEVFADKANYKSSAIFGMLKTLKEISQSNDPRGYARGLIISMAEKLDDLKNAHYFLTEALGESHQLPLIPLFERAEDLIEGPRISRQWIKLRKLKKFEVMLGYSDSSKEAGVLPSRLEIGHALSEFEQLVQENPGLRITYFHGSGGSVARGGGSLEEQTAHWPSSAFERYKVTLQGEMIQRTFSTSEIFEQYLNKVQNLGHKKNRKTAKTSPALKEFAAKISDFYRTSISDPKFLNMVEEASAYRFLEELRFGSRPSKRKKLEGISSLRAIPWILAWTQTRSLLPTWWGFGTAYSQMTSAQKNELATLGRGKDLLFTSFMHQLGFTLAKIEPAVWFMYLDQSKLSTQDKKMFFKNFLKELELTTQAFKKISGHKEPIWSKPWLQESITLRAPMIHPLNMAQLIAWKSGNASLLREASVGIACGMLTTG